MVNMEDVAFFTEKSRRIVAEVKKDILGQKETVENTVIAILAGGNVLLEGVPGVGKTRLVRSLGRALDLPFGRIQFTPDLMPADVTGTQVLEKDEQGGNRMVFRKGPVFNSILLADEINRQRPRPNRRCWRPCRSIPSPSAEPGFGWRSPFLSSPPKIPSSRMAPMCCPKPSVIGLCSS